MIIAWPIDFLKQMLQLLLKYFQSSCGQSVDTGRTLDFNLKKIDDKNSLMDDVFLTLTYSNHSNLAMAGFGRGWPTG